MDGKLNSVERNNALNALKNGFENNFIWNVEATGPYRGKRLMQVRGKFVDAEDFIPVAETYPEYPGHDNQPRVKTARELNRKRKEELISNMQRSKEQWDKLNPSSVPDEYKLSEFLVENPK